MSENLLQQVINKTISPGPFEKEIWVLSKGIERKGRIYNGSELDPIRLFRSRVFESEKLPTSQSEFSYPPIDLCKLGRANENKSPIFYASAGGPTTFVESRCKVGNIIVISEYRGTGPLLVQEVGFLNSQSEKNEYERTIHEIFTHPTNDYYEYSSKIAVHLISGNQLHGISYPSIISSNQSQNFALKIEYADNFLSLMHCTAYVIKSIEHTFKYDVEEVNFGVNNNGTIHWKGRKKRWTIKETGGQLAIRANGWQWEAYDINNKLVDPE
ncbi:hypothetical protein EON73_00535 [bacterium]|nr:MAG: hypothetical protein EON73_00535 [bacterium]